MILQHPAWLALWLVMGAGALLLRKREYVGTSKVDLLRGIPTFNLVRHLPSLLLCTGMAILVFALAGPQQIRKYSQRTISSRDILIATDVSRSMTDPWPGPIPDMVRGKTPEFEAEGAAGPNPVEAPFRKPEDLRKAQTGGRRVDAAEACIIGFIQNRAAANAGDRIGVIAFDLDPRLSWPLTTDLKQIYRKGAFLKEEQLNGGTNFGESGFGPIELADAHFSEFGKARTRVLILMTDGEAQMTPKTKERLAKLLRTQGVRFYVIGLGPQLLDPSHYTELGDFTQNWAKGIVFRANSTAELQRCFNSIDEMERSEIQVQTRQEAQPLFPLFVALGLGLLAAALIARAFIVEV